nr:hypothetical protein [Tanacetum cinerariifolium]
MESGITIHLSSITSIRDIIIIITTITLDIIISTTTITLPSSSRKRSKSPSPSLPLLVSPSSLPTIVALPLEYIESVEDDIEILRVSLASTMQETMTLHARVGSLEQHDVETMSTMNQGMSFADIEQIVAHRVANAIETISIYEAKTHVARDLMNRVEQQKDNVAKNVSNKRM